VRASIQRRRRGLGAEELLALSDEQKIPGVEIDKLAYFGASIFWRAAVRRWTVGKEKDARLPLGPYQEALRLYLLGKTGISDGVVQLVTLSTALDDLHNRVSAMPRLFERKPEYGATNS